MVFVAHVTSRAKIVIDAFGAFPADAMNGLLAARVTHCLLIARKYILVHLIYGKHLVNSEITKYIEILSILMNMSTLQ